MAYTEILTSHGLTQTQWDNMIFQEYLGQVWWSHLMGTSTDAIIQVKEDLTKKKGDAIVFGLRGQLVGGHVTGNNKGLGNEGKVDFYNQTITVDNVRDLVKFEDVPMSQQRTGFDVLQQGREALVEMARIRYEDQVTTAATTTTNRVRGRYLYGALDSNWNATHATALQNIDNVADQLTLAMIQIAKRKALVPVNATARIRPMKVKSGMRFEEWFTFVGHTYAIRDLTKNDAAWKNEKLNLPPGGDNNANTLFTGSSFKGASDGILVYEYERLPLVSSTIQCAHNLLLGAQAVLAGWAQRSKFGEEWQDLGHDVSYEIHDIRSVDKAVFNRATPEDHGIVHVFSAAVAD